MRITRARPEVVTVTATRTELATMVAGARMALDALRADPAAPPTPAAALERVLDSYDAARLRAERGAVRCTS